VRVVDAQGEMIGIHPTQEALRMAEEAGLDLVEIAPNAAPPVCRIMDYGKFKYEKSKKVKEAKKKQHVMHLKEIKLHPKTGQHDYGFKMDHARKFLMKGDRVKVTVVFRGREITHMEYGQRLLVRMENDLEDIASPEIRYKREGRNLISTFMPDKVKIAQYKKKKAQEEKKQSQEEKQQAEG
jgi:translation initiation factor IF-3